MEPPMPTIAQEWVRWLTSPQSPITLLLVIILLFFALYVLRKGWFSVKTDRIQLGRMGAEKEQLVLRRQVEYVNTAINACMRKVPKHDKFDEWRTRFVFERVIDAMVEWCMFNHIDTGRRYKSLKVGQVWNIIQKYTWHPLYQSEEFKEYVRVTVEDMIDNLVSIRVEYGDRK